MKKSKTHRTYIGRYRNTYENDSNANKLKHHLHELVQTQNLLSDVQSMHTQILRINHMLFSDPESNIKTVEIEARDASDVITFPWQTQIYLEIGFTLQSLHNSFLENVFFNELVREKSKYFHGLYELEHFLELYNVFWIHYQNQWTAQQIIEQDKLKMHYLGKCECCLALYKSFYEDDASITRSKMKQCAKKLNVNDLIEWSDEEPETELQKEEMASLNDRLAQLLL